MILEKRQCPNCGSNSIIERDGTYVCMNCRTFFDNPNDLKITLKDETEIERIKSENQKIKMDNFIAGILFLVVIIASTLILLFRK